MQSVLAFLGLASPRQRHVEVEDDVAPTVRHHVPAQHEEPPAAEVTVLNRSRRKPQVVPDLVEDGMSRIVTIHTTVFEDAEDVGLQFRDGVPVILDLSQVEPAVAQRLVDYSVGLVHGLQGQLDCVTPDVFLLTPAGVETGDNTSHQDEEDDDEEESGPRKFFGAV